MMDFTLCLRGEDDTKKVHEQTTAEEGIKKKTETMIIAWQAKEKFLRLIRS